MAVDYKDQFLTVPQIAEQLGSHKGTIRKMLREKTLPGRRIGGEWRCRREDFIRFFRGDLQPAEGR